ncbi:hypothetical protein THAOC_13610, partial [Thalassiosira oceanica]
MIPPLSSRDALPYCPLSMANASSWDRIASDDSSRTRSRSPVRSSESASRMFGPSWDFSYSLPVSQNVPLRLSGFSIAIEPSVGRNRLASSTDEADLIAVRRRGDTELSAALFGSSFLLPSLLTLCGLSSTIWVGPTPGHFGRVDGGTGRARVLDVCVPRKPSQRHIHRRCVRTSTRPLPPAAAIAATATSGRAPNSTRRPRIAAGSSSGGGPALPGGRGGTPAGTGEGAAARGRRPSGGMPLGREERVEAVAKFYRVVDLYGIG